MNREVNCKSIGVWKKFLFVFIAVFGGIGIALLGMELVLQLIYGPVADESTNADPILHHFSGNNPNVNAYGFYDKSYPKEKPAGTRRIMMVGDSLVNRTVTGVNFAKEIEKRCKTAFSTPAFEVWNCGIDSYSPALEYLLIRHKLLALNPDLIVVCVFMGNDFNDDAVYESTLEFDRDGKPLRCSPDREKSEKSLISGQLRIPFKNYLRYHSRLYRELSRSYNTILHRVGVRQGEWGKAKIDLHQTAPIGTLTTNISGDLFQLLTRNLLFIRDLLKENRIQFMVVLIPLDAQVYKPVNADVKKILFRNEDIENANENENKLRIVLEEKGIEVVDLLPYLRNSPKQPLYIVGSHFNIDGERLVAEVLFDPLTKRFTLFPPDAAPPDPERNPGSR